MREEKKYISQEYLERLESSPFFIVADYHGLKMGPFGDLRNKLREVNAEIHVVKNKIFAVTAAQVGAEGLKDEMVGQLAVVTGTGEIAAAAKVVKTFASEFAKPDIKFGYLDKERLESDEIKAIADLPSIEVLRAKLLGVIQAPAGNLARIIGTPGTQLAQVLKAKADKG